MRANRDHAIDLILAQEGGYVDHPSDPGGCTNRGITIATYRAHVDPHGTCADLRAMSDDVARSIYAERYWSAVNADALPSGLDLVVFDFGVNAGPARAARMLQRILGVAEDGSIGPVTLSAAFARDRENLIHDFSDDRLEYYKGLKTWPVFGRGWTRRTEQIRNEALEYPLVQVAPKPQVDAPANTGSEVGPAVLVLTLAGVEVARISIPYGVDATIEATT